MKIPPKIRNFWRRAINNFQPSTEELRRRHVGLESYCEDCGNHKETVFHVATECMYALCFWEALKEITGKKIPRATSSNVGQRLACWEHGKLFGRNFVGSRRYRWGLIKFHIRQKKNGFISFSSKFNCQFKINFDKFRLYI